MRNHIPVVVAGADDEGSCAKVAGTPVLSECGTVVAARLNASEILQDFIDDAIRDSDPLPQPGSPAIHEPTSPRGVIEAVLPAEAA